MVEMTSADKEIRDCINKRQSFAVVAGAGSGKTSSLTRALKYIDSNCGESLRRKNQKVVCITYTKRARDELRQRLDDDKIFVVSTIHSFLWGEVSRFTQDIANQISESVIRKKIDKCKLVANGGGEKSKSAQAEIETLREEINCIEKISRFEYDNNGYSKFNEGKIGHDDVITIATKLITISPILQKILGHKYPFIFVDEAQDTDRLVIDALNIIVERTQLVCLGYFGDPMQQIYDTGVGEICGPKDFKLIKKCENYRSVPKIINLANALREDVKQISAGRFSQSDGEVRLNIVQAEEPEGKKNRYTDVQLERAANRYDAVLEKISWTNDANSKCLFLTRQMIARRLKFINLHKVFTGNYASQNTKNRFEDGSHYLLKPIIQVIWPVLSAIENGDEHEVLRILRTHSPLFYVGVPNDERSLKDVVLLVRLHLGRLKELWHSGSIKGVLRYVNENRLYRAHAALESHLSRSPRQEVYNDTLNQQEKSDWLADEFFRTDIKEIQAYADFINTNSPFSTQHGVKGEEYDNVLVFFDDVEAAWSQYSFSKLLLPDISVKGTDRQIRRSRRLAYVCFTRARRILQVILFSLKPQEAKKELVSKGMFEKSQVRIIET